MVEVEQLTKVYRVPEKDPGLAGSLRALYRRRWKEVRAVDAVTFAIQPGERVGFLGPNGAGKTTTLKMLTGLLHPTSGRVRVAGFEPRDRKPAFLRTISLVMGQKQQLIWDLPPMETFLLNRALYDLPRAQWQAALDELVALLELSEFLAQPVRNLSLGQRMRCELAAALLHAPRVLFLDEPTIGLDVEVQVAVRRFVRAYNERNGATVMLTSHDANDVTALVERLILIDKGVVRFDGPISAFQQRFGGGRRLTVGSSAASLADLGFTPAGRDRWEVTTPAATVNGLLAAVLQRAPTADVTVTDPPLEEVLTAAFGAARAERAAESP